MPEAVPDYPAGLAGDIRGLKIGLPTEYFAEGLQPEVEAAVRCAVAELEALGAEVRELRFRHAEYCLPAYYIIAMAEASANLARYDGVRFGARLDGADLIDSYKKTRGSGFGAEVKRRIMLGTYTLSAGYYDAYYGKAQAVRTLIRKDFDALFEQVDALIAPAAPTTAFGFGEVSDDPLRMILADVLTISANLAGICGLSVPCGFDEIRLAHWHADPGRALQRGPLAALGAGLSKRDRLAPAVAVAGGLGFRRSPQWYSTSQEFVMRHGEISGVLHVGDPRLAPASLVGY